MLETEIGLAYVSELNWSGSFLQYNAKKKIKAKSSSRFEFKFWIRNTTSLKQLIYCYNNASFAIAFLSEDNYFLRCKVHSLRQYLFNFHLSKIKCKRPKVNSEPTHFLAFVNNSLDGMACSYQCSNQFQFLPGHWPAKRHWILKKPNLKIILITPGIIWSLKFKTKRMVELWNY